MATGTVTGHVYIQGANTPARLVNVNLQTLTVTDEYARLKSGTPVPLPVSVYQTDLNGSYTIPNVPAGLYYVVVSMPGFVSPFSTFTRQQLEHPTTAIARQIAAELPVISVQPNTTTTQDVTVQKGALLGGTVCGPNGYRDCSPDLDANAALTQNSFGASIFRQWTTRSFTPSRC